MKTNKNNNNKFIIIIIVMVIILLVALGFLFFNKDKEPSKKVDNNKEVKTKIIKKTNVVGYLLHNGYNTGVRYFANDTCIDENNKLIGKCAVSELSDKEFLSYVEIEETNEYVLLSKDGTVYVTSNGTISRIINHNYGDRIEKLASITIEDENDCSKKTVLVAKVGGVEYLLEDYEELVYNHYSAKQPLLRVYSNTCDFKGLTFNINKGLLTSTGRVIKDSDNNNELLVYYLLYKNDTKDIYVIANDKLFIMKEEKDRVKAYGTITSIDFKEDKDAGTYLLTVDLKEGEEFIFSSK